MLMFSFKSLRCFLHSTILDISRGWLLLFRTTAEWRIGNEYCSMSQDKSHATLDLVWPGHKGYENSHAKSRFPTLILVWPRLTVINLIKFFTTRPISRVCFRNLLRSDHLRSRTRIFIYAKFRQRFSKSLVRFFRHLKKVSRWPQARTIGERSFVDAILYKP